MRKIAFLAVVIGGLAAPFFMLGCSGGGGDSPTPEAQPYRFPPFDQVRTDLPDISEGTAGNPLKIAALRCPYQPVEPWQDWLCRGDPVQTVYPQSNGFSARDPYNAWIIVFNNEPIEAPGCNMGPPNQSIGDEYPFDLIATPQALTLAVLHDSRPYCNKLPYMSASVVRGVQGDPKPQMYTWAELQGKTLTIDVDTQRSGTAWFRVLLHFRDAQGVRYFVNKDYAMPDTLPDFPMNWAWPFVNSFQYPGAHIVIPARDPAKSIPIGAQTIMLQPAAMALQYFPVFANSRPDFLGIEIAVELAGVGESSVKISRIDLR